MRLLAFLQFTMVVVGIIGVVAGQFFALPKGVYFGVFLIGAGIALGGLESLITRRICFRTAEERFEDYEGTPAVIVGLMALLIGSAIVFSAQLLNDGLWISTLQRLLRRPGPLLIAGGILAMCLGTLMMLNPTGRRGVAWTLLVRVPRSVLGLLIALAGFASIALGVWEWFEPLAAGRVLHQIERLDWRSLWIGVKRSLGVGR
jgi:hypothetical protein